MEQHKILDADILDILFEGRNKEYGAYDLRKTYHQRMRIALLSTGLVCGLFFGGYLLANNFNTGSDRMAVKDFNLTTVEPPEKKVEPPPLPPPPQQVQKIETTKFTPPKIVKEEEVPEDEKPPVMDELEDTRIGTVNQEGLKDNDIVAPPVNDEGKGIVEAPKKEEEDYEKTFVSVQIESEYPGGPREWQRYLNKSLRYPQEAMDNEIQGPVMVQFIVDKDGIVSNVEVLSGPEELRAEAIRVIKKSGNWKPAIQNGRQVKSYKRQSILFQLQTDN